MKTILPEETDVFIQGQEGYPNYRIPSIIVTQKGTLLAFCEARQSLVEDHSENDLVLKRSTDGGKTWGPHQVISTDGKNSLNDPTAVVVEETGQILLFYVKFPYGPDGYRYRPGIEGEPITRIFVIHSIDDGKTWSKPRDITTSTKKPDFSFVCVGEGVAIQLRRGTHKGRIVVPCNHISSGERKTYVSYSDDLGQTWHVGGESGPGTNESQIVEQVDGSIMVNARSYREKGCRATSISQDGGASWSPVSDDETLVESICQASFLRYTDILDGSKSRLLFSNPASTQGRVKGTVRLSYDEGMSWPIAKTIYPGSFAYSCLTVLPDMSIGCLYEKNDYKTLTFARFTLEWLTDGKDRIEIQPGI